MSYLRIKIFIFIILFSGFLYGSESIVVSSGSRYFLSSESLKELKIKALGGDSGSALRVANYYIFFEMDEVESFFWQKISAENGNSLAALSLGGMYRDYFQDDEKAIFWYSKAVEGAEIEEVILANNGIGDLLWSKQRYSESIDSYYQSAIRGSGRAVKKIILYNFEDKYGVKNYMHAYAWTLFLQDVLMKGTFSYDESEILIEKIGEKITESEFKESTKLFHKLKGLANQGGANIVLDNL